MPPTPQLRGGEDPPTGLPGGTQSDDASPRHSFGLLRNQWSINLSCLCAFGRVARSSFLSSAASTPTPALSWLLPLGVGVGDGQSRTLCASPTSSSHSRVDIAGGSPVSPPSLHSAFSVFPPLGPQPPLNSQQHTGPRPAPASAAASRSLSSVWPRPPVGHGSNRPWPALLIGRCHRCP